MPIKVLPDKEAFGHFCLYMEKEGFRKLSGAEFLIPFRNLDLHAPRPREGRETGFVFTDKGLKVHIWTTFLESEGEAREEDSGWVLITENGRRDYCSHPLMRTEGFLRKLFRTAQIAKERVEKRPHCPTCNAFMHIAKGRAIKSRYWKCTGTSPHYHRMRTLPWDYGLCDESIIFLQAQRRERRRYQTALKKAGKTVTPAILMRKPWSAHN
jgi:hypothetical protein